MNREKIFSFSFIFISAILSTHAWAGPGSTTDDLMSQLQNLNTSSSSIVPVEVLDNCPAAQAIDAANLEAENNNLPFNKPWVVFKNLALLREPFNLKKTLNHIIESSGANSTTPAELMKSMIDSQSLSSATNPVSGLKTPLDPRMLESQINPQAAVDEWFPVGVFNRLDTAPKDGGHCGEYRIVYANPGSSATDPSLRAGAGRFFTIFEAAIPNPQPDKGVQGCQPIGEFWASLANPSLNDEDRVELLEKFFYKGLDTSSSGETISIEPAVSFSHYKPPLGQVRTNEFLEFRWQLREFKTALNESNETIFSVETVKNNALTEFYNLESSIPLGDSDELDLFNTLSDEFQETFVTELMHQLTSADNTVQDGKTLVNRISMVVPNKFNEFQSDSQIAEDDITQQAGSSLKVRIDTELDSINTIQTNINQDHVLARTEAMSCGGCHEFANDKVIANLTNGAEVKWPRSGGFVHIDEEGKLSEALRDAFLPAREEVLKAFVCAGTAAHECSEQTTELTQDSANVEASGTLSSFFQPWKAFDKQPSSLWISATNETPAWISYSWDTPLAISQYSITYANWGITSYAPKAWELQGWNGQNWKTVDSRLNEVNWSSGESRSYTIPPSQVSYDKYRLHFSDDNNDHHAGVLLLPIAEISFKSCNQ
jgi:hypothetical protein